MAFINKPYAYQRNVLPVSPESLQRYYQEELKKLEQVTSQLTAALVELEARATAHAV